MQFGFPKEQRLCSRRIINGLASEGKVLFKYPFKAYYKPGEADVPRYVISVPKKSFKRAVWRNTLKRRTREAIRLNQTAVLGGFKADYLFVYIAREERPFEEIQAAVVDILTRSAADAGTAAAGLTNSAKNAASDAGKPSDAAAGSTMSDNPTTAGIHAAACGKTPSHEQPCSQAANQAGTTKATGEGEPTNAVEQ